MEKMHQMKINITAKKRGEQLILPEKNEESVATPSNCPNEGDTLIPTEAVQETNENSGEVYRTDYRRLLKTVKKSRANDESAEPCKIAESGKSVGVKRDESVGVKNEVSFEIAMTKQQLKRALKIMSCNFVPNNYYFLRPL